MYAKLEALFECDHDAGFEKREIVSCDDFKLHAQNRLEAVHEQLVLILP